MQLLIIRHADAGDKNEWAETGRPDSERPLSEKGRRQFPRAAKALSRLVPDVGLVATSPFTRALETSDIYLENLATSTTRKLTESLIPDAEPTAFIRWIGDQRRRKVVAIVGHEPHLGLMATWLVAGLDESMLTLRKGGACLISFEKTVGKNKGTLEWLLEPAHLRRL
jgi:phosphohistidine phosphatase